MRIAPVSLWTRLSCSILPNLLDLFKTYMILIHFLLACRSCGPWPFHAWRQYDHTHLAKTIKWPFLQGKISKQHLQCRMKLVLPRLKKVTSELPEPCHVLQIYHSQTMLKGNFRSTFRYLCPPSATKPSGKEPSAPPRPSTQMAQVRSLLDISRCFRLATRLTSTPRKTMMEFLKGKSSMATC